MNTKTCIIDIHSACKVFIDSLSVYTHKKKVSSPPFICICILQYWGELRRPLNEDLEHLPSPPAVNKYREPPCTYKATETCARANYTAVRQWYIL